MQYNPAAPVACNRCRPVTARTLVIEAVDAVDAGTLVVATQDEEVLWILDLVRHQQADGLQALLASVNVVSARNALGRQRAWPVRWPERRRADFLHRLLPLFSP